MDFLNLVNEKSEVRDFANNLQKRSREILVGMIAEGKTVAEASKALTQKLNEWPEFKNHEDYILSSIDMISESLKYAILVENNIITNIKEEPKLFFESAELASETFNKLLKEHAGSGCIFMNEGEFVEDTVDESGDIDTTEIVEVPMIPVDMAIKAVQSVIDGEFDNAEDAVSAIRAVPADASPEAVATESKKHLKEATKAGSTDPNPIKDIVNRLKYTSYFVNFNTPIKFAIGIDNMIDGDKLKAQDFFLMNAKNADGDFVGELDDYEASLEFIKNNRDAIIAEYTDSVKPPAMHANIDKQDIIDQILALDAPIKPDQLLQFQTMIDKVAKKQKPSFSLED